MGWFSRDKPTIPEKVEKNKRISVKPPISSPFVASIQDILTETESMRSQGYKQYGSVYDSEFDLFTLNSMVQSEQYHLQATNTSLIMQKQRIRKSVNRLNNLLLMLT